MQFIPVLLLVIVLLPTQTTVTLRLPHPVCEEGATRPGLDDQSDPKPEKRALLAAHVYWFGADSSAVSQYLAHGRHPVKLC